MKERSVVPLRVRAEGGAVYAGGHFQFDNFFKSQEGFFIDLKKN